jgi:hypothetical protein
MLLCHSWGWQPPQTASHIHLRHIQCLSTLICCPLAYSCSLTQLYPLYLAQILGFWVTCGVKMMLSCHSWCWQQSQNASHIHIRHIHSVWAHWYAVHWHMVAALHRYTPPYLAQNLGFWVTCGAKMMLLCHSWGWQPLQTASHIHIIHTQCLSTLIFCPLAYSCSLT